MTSNHSHRLRGTLLALALVGAGCGADAADPGSADPDQPSADAGSGSDTTTSGDADGSVTSAVFDDSVVHSISVEFDPAEYEQMIATYQSDSTKDWIEATVQIDGSTYAEAGIRLKGNSSLAGLGGGFGGRGGTGGDTSSEVPEELPWLIKLDKYVDGQAHEGVSDFVVRSNGTETSLNEAVALALLDEAGLATEDAIAVRFSVNGSDEVLRLVIEHPDDVWMADNFDASDALYKAESTGNYSYRGEDPEAYDDVFDQEAGKDNTDLGPLIEFLDFINNSDDETFAAGLADRFDTEGFATYLAMQEVVQNFDDIDGPGNNSYLHWDSSTGRFTVVPWDYNLAFGGFGGGGFGQGGGPGGRGGFGPGDIDPEDLPEGFELPDDVDLENLPGDLPDRGDFGGGGPAGGGPGGGGFGGGNVLVQRFLAVDEFNTLYEEALANLTASLVESGRAEEIIDEWVAVLSSGAADLVTTSVIEAEAEQVRDALGS